MLSEQCLLCLSELIGWIDIKIITSVILTSLYDLLRAFSDQTKAISNENENILKRSILVCMYELCKKGMDPVEKVQMFQSIGLMDMIILCCNNRNNNIRTDDDNTWEEKLGKIPLGVGIVL